MELKGQVVKTGKGYLVVHTNLGTVKVETDIQAAKGTSVTLDVEYKNGRFVAKKVEFDSGDYVLKYLMSIKGIGPKTAEKLYREYGESIIERIKDEEFLKRVTGGRATSSASWLKGYEKVYGLLRTAVGEKRAESAVRFLKREKVSFEENPYVLLKLKGFGFKTVDRIALQFIPEDSPLRIRQLVRYLLEQAEQKGHMYLEVDDLKKKLMAHLGREVPLVLPEDVKRTGDKIYLEKNLETERKIATYLSCQETYEEERKTSPELKLTEEQERAVELCLRNKICAITGYAGTGKTTVLREVVKEFESRGYEIALLAPTGKAAKRLEEVLKRPAFTIHRAVYQDELIFPDVVIVDESSMIDSHTMKWLLSYVYDKRVIFVGDTAQLPPVGPGQPFRDLVESGEVPTARLTKILRNAGEIVISADRVRRGDFPLKTKGNFCWHTAFSEEKIAALLEKAKEKGVEVQLLGGIYKGRYGVDSLNRLAQEVLNPDGGREWKGFRVGDRVIHTGSNDYNSFVMNGDTGKVVEVQQGKVAVEFWDGKTKTYTSDDVQNLSLAYAMTVHKSQGSEYDYAAVVFDTSSYSVINRYWLYTALTRAKKKCFLFADMKAVATAVKNSSYPERKTFLRELIGNKELFNDIDNKQNLMQRLSF